MKKKFVSLLILGLLAISPAFAENVQSALKDVPADYWAKTEIETVVTQNIMKPDSEGNFKPETCLTRIEFVQALLKILSNDNLDVNITNTFTDINESNAYYKDVLRSEQLGIIYGYPDNTFLPNNTMLRSETTSVISHITKDKYVDCSILTPYVDKNDIPEWAKLPYAKSISYGIFVNHPNENKLEPNRNITRAEAAVLLARLKDKLTVVKPEYIAPAEVTLSVEHINLVKKAPETKVEITNYRKIIKQGNVIPVAYETEFASKTTAEYSEVIFVLNEALCTDEGTLLLPQGTKLKAEVSSIEQPNFFNKPAKVFVNYKEFVLPNGTTYKVEAKTFTKDNSLKESLWFTIPKALTGIGAITSGVNYKAKAGEIVNIVLLNDVCLTNSQKMEEPVTP